jgi:1,4-dihydroxy-2-naphthoyl-CoA synthase
MSFQDLKVETSDRVGWIEYRRPPLNAFNWEMLYEVPKALTQLLDDSDTRVIVSASALEKYFSTGADLKVFQAMGPGDLRRWVENCHSLVLQMRSAEKPLLASINGTAVGGGLEMVLHCDLRFAANDAKLGQPEINIAFIPPVGATQGMEDYWADRGRSGFFMRADRCRHKRRWRSGWLILSCLLTDFGQRRPPMLWRLRESLPAPWQPFGVASRRV